MIILRLKRRLAGAGERHGQWIDLAIRLLSQHAARYTVEPQGKGHRKWRITHQQLHKPVSRQGYHARANLATKKTSVPSFDGVSSRPGPAAVPAANGRGAEVQPWWRFRKSATCISPSDRKSPRL